MRHHYHHPDGRRTPKFINLDMEEYRDLELTVSAFRAVLDEAEFLPLSAGPALQAYVPDSSPVQRALTTTRAEYLVIIGCSRRGIAGITIEELKSPAGRSGGRVITPEHRFPDCPHALEVRPSSQRILSSYELAPILTTQHCKTDPQEGNEGVIRPQYAFLDLQCALVEGTSGKQVPFVSQQLGQFEEAE
jgi:hypothetical protein